jgi:replicative DNA helicase
LKDKVDVENLYSQIITDIVSAKSGKDYSECFTKIGKSSNCNDKLKKLLIGDTLRFIPTGFGGWDSKNQGLPLGKMALVASTSGGGKSLMGIQLATNMALDGYRICIVPLEMSSEDMLHRMLANRTDMDMSEVAKGKKTEGNKRLKAYADFRAYEQMLANKNASIDLFEPPEDITMEDLLFVLQPYKYDVIIIDYIGLLKGFDGDNQWRKMGEAARFAKRWASTNNSTVMLMAQLNDDMIVRYSRAMKEHADLMWTWNSGKVSALENGEAIIKIEPQKGRNQEQSVFYLHSSFKKMRMTDASQEEIETYESKMKDNKPENNNKNRGKKFKIKDIEERRV